MLVSFSTQFMNMFTSITLTLDLCGTPLLTFIPCENSSFTITLCFCSFKHFSPLSFPLSFLQVSSLIIPICMLFNLFQEGRKKRERSNFIVWFLLAVLYPCLKINCLWKYTFLPPLVVVGAFMVNQGEMMNVQGALRNSILIFKSQ